MRWGEVSKSWMDRSTVLLTGCLPLLEDTRMWITWSLLLSFITFFHILLVPSYIWFHFSMLLFNIANYVIYYVYYSYCYVCSVLWVIIIGSSVSISIQFLGQFGPEPESSQVTGMDLVRCILGTFLGLVCHCSPRLDVPTFASTSAKTREILAANGGRMSEKVCPVILPNLL